MHICALKVICIDSFFFNFMSTVKVLLPQWCWSSCYIGTVVVVVVDGDKGVAKEELENPFVYELVCTWQVRSIVVLV